MTHGDEPINSIICGPDGESLAIEFEGLTKREYFAAMAFSGMQSENPSLGLRAESLAQYAVEMSDALIDALNKE